MPVNSPSALVCAKGAFVGSHLVKQTKREGAFGTWRRSEIAGIRFHRRRRFIQPDLFPIEKFVNAPFMTSGEYTNWPRTWAARIHRKK